MADPKTYYFNLPRGPRPSNVALREEWFPDIKAAALRTSAAPRCIKRGSSCPMGG